MQIPNTLPPANHVRTYGNGTVKSTILWIHTHGVFVPVSKASNSIFSNEVASNLDTVVSKVMTKNKLNLAQLSLSERILARLSLFYLICSMMSCSSLTINKFSINQKNII